MDTLKTKQLLRGGGEVSGSVSCAWVLVDYCLSLNHLLPLVRILHFGDNEWPCLSSEGWCPMLILGYTAHPIYNALIVLFAQ